MTRNRIIGNWFIAVSGAAATLACVAAASGASSHFLKPVSLRPKTVAPARVRPLEYNRDIEPVLAASCFTCHGPDPGARQAGLRLDSAAGAFKKAASGQTPIVPGRPDLSEVYQRITATGGLHMPPDYSHKTITPAQVAVIKLWIAQGAHYQPHWAYIPPVRPALPSVKNPAWCLNPIDRFILAHLESAGASPSPAADRRTLIRRVSLDLVGLPPAAREVEAFVNDRSPHAYENLVDRLLASPHFGERMAIRWLDLVRYADSDGYHGDQFRSVFPYRDYVINAFNHDKPFDQFTIEQIAGDLLPNATIEQRVASGYNRLNMITREGGAQDKEYLAKYGADRVRTTSVAWLGSTIGCAECHDHKFDQFTSRDFYSFKAFFADLKQVGVYQNDGPVMPDMAVPTPDQDTALEQAEAQVKQINANLEASTPALATAQAAWEHAEAAKLAPWSILHPSTVESAGGATLTVQPDDSVLASGKHPATDSYSITTTTKLAGITAVRVEVLPDPSLPLNGPGRSDNGNFVLTGMTVTAKTTAGGTDEPVSLQHATATWEQTSGADANPGKAWSAALAIDPKKKDPTQGWAILDEVGKPNAAVFETASNVGDGQPTTLTFHLEFQFPLHQIGRLRLSALTSPRPVQALPDGIPEDVAAALSVEAPKRTADQLSAIAAYYRSIDPGLQPLRTALAAAQKHQAEIEQSIPRTLVSESVTPAVTRLLPRGNWMDESGPVLAPAAPHFLPGPPPNAPTNRLTLARWIASRQNPLTARVLVNRLWEMLFGSGIVRTVDDFGTQGARPTHPELLDWLAVELMDNGWRIKPVLKLMVLSNAYKQSSRAAPSMLQRDPYNLLLARQGRFRLPAELVRDNELAIAGLLSDRIGGRSVEPYQPDHYWDNCNTFTGPLIYHQDHGPDLYRRGLYTIWKRSFLHPSLLAFDAPTREECTAVRTVSNSPLQALVLLDDPTYVEAARVLGERMIRDGGSTPASRIDWAFRQALSRPATNQERAILSALQQRHLADYRTDSAAAAKLITIGETLRPKDIDAPTLASWTSVARVILNLSETITRE